MNLYFIILRKNNKMNNLINLYENKEIMTLTIEGQDYYIKLQGTTENPYFCGKDVCSILKYKDINKALQVHVDSEYKKPLKEVTPKMAHLKFTITHSKIR